MADEKYDPTAESDASATPESADRDREPTGSEFLNNPDHVDSLGQERDEDDTAFDPAEVDEDVLAEAEAEVAEDDGDGVIDAEEAARGRARHAEETRDDEGDRDDEYAESTEEPGDAELALAGRGSRRPVRRGAEVAETEAATGRRSKKRPTPKQKRAPEDRRTGPVKFVEESVGELRKVVWPTGEQLRGYFMVVLVFVLFIIAFVSLLDLGYGWLILKVFG